MMRTSTACDICVLRRVKCDEQRPCQECRKRCLECTTQRTRKKRGPKGPRISTMERAQRLRHKLMDVSEHGSDKDGPLSPVSKRSCSHDRDEQQHQQHQQHQQQHQHQQQQQQQRSLRSESISQDSGGSRSSSSSSSSNGDNDVPHEPLPPSIPLQLFAPKWLPLTAYTSFLHIFRRQLYPIWPVVPVPALIASISVDAEAHESKAFAAALCAATIAQLRLEEHSVQPSASTVSSHQFALDAQHCRNLFDYREQLTVASLLTSFFLHIYYANTTKLQTAALFLRESIYFAHGLRLDQPELHSDLPRSEQSLRLRVYWLLFVSERTFCVQNGLRAIMHPIDTFPPVEDDVEGADLLAFTSLVRLFSCLHTDIVSPVRRRSKLPATDKQLIDVGKISSCCKFDEHASNQTQKVDLCVTRQWIRILEWEYIQHHFTMSSYQAADPALSLFLPVVVGREILSTVTAMDEASIRAHGYGMELKLFKIADCVTDVVFCAPEAQHYNSMLFGSRDILVSILDILVTLGGVRSEFSLNLQAHMARLPGPSPRPCLAFEDDQRDPLGRPCGIVNRVEEVA